MSTPPTSNIIGTMFNSPIYTYTNCVNRMVVNGDRTATIGAALGGFNVPTNGYVGIGPNTPTLPRASRSWC